MSHLTRFRLWWCAYRQSWMANPCVCNTYDPMNGCGWVDHTEGET